MLNVLIGFAVLGLLYVLLIKEIMHRTVAAAFTASLTILILFLLNIHAYEELLMGIDIDTILLLMSMMIMVTIMSRSNLFTYIAILIIKKTGDNPFILMSILGLIAGTISAFIDNVTTVILITPIILQIAREIRMDPRPLLLAIVFESNIGGTATLIGDPPNILIGTAADLGFNDFIVNLSPIVAVDALITLIIFKLLYKNWFNEWRKRAKNIYIEEHVELDKPLLYKSLSVFIFVIILFFLEDAFHYPPAIPAVIGAGLLLACVARSISIHEVLEGVEWSTLVFFIFMFIVIRGVELLGVMDFIASSISSLNLSREIIIVIIVWVSAIFSAFVDNIPFVMSMIPVIKYLNHVLHITNPVLYWALSLGGCLGGNGTLVGASANVVVASIAEKHGYSINFNYFMKRGMIIMIITVALSTIYLLLFY